MTARTVQDLLLEAVRRHQGGDVDAAVPLYRCALAADPGNPDVLALLGTALARRGAFSAGLRLLRRALSTEATHPAAIRNLESLLGERIITVLHRLDGDRPAEAEALCREVLSALPDHVEALHHLGQALANQDRWEDALLVFGQAAAALRLAPLVPPRP